MMGSMMRRAMLGDGSTLSLDFTQMSTLADLTSRGLTFSRSTSGTFINANGLVATATAGNPRFEYDTNGNPRGILIEGNATNLVYHSETFRLTAVATEPFWADSASLSRGTDTAPDGTANAAVNFVAIGIAGTVIQTAAVGTSANRTFSFWAKRSVGGTVEYTLDNGSTWIAVTITANWVRYTATATNANQRVGFRVATGTGTSIWGAMLEAGSGSSSYIPSGASQGSRANESLYLDGASFAAFWPSGQSQYSVYFAGDITRSPATTQFVWLARTGSGGVGASRARNFVTSASAIRANTTVNDLVSGLNASVNTTIRTALGVSSGSCALSTNNGTTSAIVTNADTGLSTDAAQLVFNPNSDVFQHIKTLKYWPTRLSDAQLQALTT